MKWLCCFWVFISVCLYAQTPKTDSIRVKPQTLRLRSQELYSGLTKYDSLSYSLERFHWFDEGDTIPNWRLQLGQVGKPTMPLQGGLPLAYFPTNYFTDPITGEIIPYVLSEKQIPYYNTRTPFTKVAFWQASRQAQLLETQVSQNISPYWNTSVFYRRRSAIGAYLNHTTDHYNIAFSHHVHDYKKRFQLVAGVTWQQLQDQFNGGLAPDENFIKFSQTRSNNASYSRRFRTAYLQPFVRFLGNDSSLFRVVFHGKLSFLEYNRLFSDNSPDSAVYPVWYNSSFSAFQESFLCFERNYQMGGTIGGHFRTWNWSARYESKLKELSVNQYLVEDSIKGVHQRQLEQSVSGIVESNRLRVQGNFGLMTSRL
ncbi:MAG: putative porin, partial [Bacteroidia bacterium]|nr:putative porin [Bacteroidia bacterium]